MAKIKTLMTKKEFSLLDSGSAKNVKLHSAARLKQFIQLSRRLRDKYRDLNRRQRVAQKPSQNLRTVEKARAFAKVLERYERQYQSHVDGL